MMKRFLSTIFVAIATFGVAHAVIVQKVYLKNGTVLEGFIQSQNGSGTMMVHTDKATIYVSGVHADVFDHRTKYASLDNAWQKWADKNDAYDGVGDGRSLLLNDVSFKENVNDSVASDPKIKNFEDYLIRRMRTVSNVKVLERGVMVKYLELTPNNYLVSWDDIISIKADRRQKNALSGINCIYQLKNGKTFEGQYAEDTGNTLSLYMDGGLVQSFKSSDVVKYTYRGINPNQDIFEQSELLDVIRTNSGATVKGIILEQNYSSKKDSENLFLIKQKSGAIQTIKVSEIRELRKEANPSYNPKFDIMLKNGEVVVNRTPASYVKVTEDNDMLLLDSIGKLQISQAGKGLTQVTVEYRMDGVTNVEAFQLVKVTQTKIKRQNVYAFSYKDLVNAVVRPTQIETSMNQTTKAVYNVYGTGVFALYDAKSRKAIPFTIK